MTLYERTRCAVVDCTRQRHPDARVCTADLNELWANRLVLRPDGRYDRRRVLPARDLTGAIRSAAA